MRQATVKIQSRLRDACSGEMEAPFDTAIAPRAPAVLAESPDPSEFSQYQSADGAICVVSTQATPLLFQRAKINEKPSRNTEWLS